MLSPDTADTLSLACWIIAAVAAVTALVLLPFQRPREAAEPRPLGAVGSPLHRATRNGAKEKPA